MEKIQFFSEGDTFVTFKQAEDGQWQQFKIVKKTGVTVINTDGKNIMVEDKGKMKIINLNSDGNKYLVPASFSAKNEDGDYIAAFKFLEEDMPIYGYFASSYKGKDGGGMIHHIKQVGDIVTIVEPNDNNVVATISNGSLVSIEGFDKYQDDDSNDGECNCPACSIHRIMRMQMQEAEQEQS